METLISQRRESFSDSGQRKKDASIKPRDGIPQEKTRSFKEDKKESKTLQWYFSNQMDEDYDPTARDIEFATAVGSAAYAIGLQEETTNPEHGKDSVIETRADVWERHKMEKIRERYGKIKSSILAWENKKKMRAKLDKENKMAELERKKALFLQYYQDNIVLIDQITKGVRAQLEEKRRKEEKKTREAANRIRSTGRLPVTCFCFQCH